MRSEHPDSYMPHEEGNEKAAASRLTDEKISDETGTEATADRIFAPAELDNPFWN